MYRIALLLLQLPLMGYSQSETKLAPTPPLGWMTWNYFGENINEKIIKEMADAMELSGMIKAGYKYIMIDDGWQGGRDNRNQIIADSKKFPSGIKTLADYVHSKGLGLGIYSDASPLTCAGYTASLNFEEQDAKTFASWGIDYLKYDYCNAPTDSNTAKIRYKKMADALRNSGRNIVFSICEWGDRQPWLWAAGVGGQLWRTTFDVRDSWANMSAILDINSGLSAHAGPGHWNDPDMLIVGLRGNKGPASEYGGIGCNDIEYQSNMSLWAIMAAPLIATNDIRTMSDATKSILLNEEVIAINQDALGKQATRINLNDSLNVFIKPLANGETAVAILNRKSTAQTAEIDFSTIFLQQGTSPNPGALYEVKDLWLHKQIGTVKKWKGTLLPHETRLFRVKTH